VIDRLLTAAGVDATQWRGLLRVFVRVDFSQLLGAFGRAQAVRSGAGLFFSALFYGMSGFAVSVLGLASEDRWLGATLVGGYIAFVVSSNVLATHASTIVSPDDHAILGYRPITSRTYLAVRVATILVHTGVTATLVGFSPVVVYGITLGFRAAAATAVMIVLTSVAATLAIVVSYAWLLDAVGADRLNRAVSYAQLATTSLMYLGIAALSESAIRHAMAGTSLPPTPLILLFPGTWFGALVALAVGDHRPVVEVGAALAIASVSALIVALNGRLSLTYSARLAAVASAAAERHAAAPARAWRLPFFNRDEARAVSMLIWTQFKYDNRFRLGVLTFVPLTIFYLFLGGRDSQIADPFVTSSIRSQSTMVLQLVLYFLPMSLTQLLRSSDAYRAAWIFYATPADRTRLVTSARNVISMLVIFPYVLLLAAYYGWAFHNVAHGLLHALFLGLMSQLAFAVVVCADPALPFSEPPNRNRQAGTLFGLMLALGIAGSIAQAIVASVVYPRPWLFACTIALFVTGAWSIDRLTRARMATRSDERLFLS
jgi:hypothetical protein